jgi:hexosaminidase
MIPFFSSDDTDVIRSSLWKQVSWFAIAALSAILLFSNRVAATESSGLALSVSWRLLDNLRENRFIAEIELRNDGNVSLADDWALYFNSASKLSPLSGGADFQLLHINGDFYILRPKKYAKSIAPGEHRKISIEGSPWAINVSDAPSGFYLIGGERGGNAVKPSPVAVHIEPFPPAAKLHRGSADIVPIVTAESRFIENEPLKKLPQEQLIKVIPTPVEIKPQSGTFVLKLSTTLFFDSSLRNEAAFFADASGELLDERIACEETTPKTTSGPDSVRLRIADITVAGSLRKKGDEAYVLTITPESGVEIVGSDSAGVFYGIQTLRGLIPIESYRHKNREIPIDRVGIADAPRFRYRGLHLDVARNFQSKQTIEKLLDVMALYKFNKLHLHLTDDEGWRLEIKQLPELTQVGARRGHTLEEATNLVPSHGSGPFADAKALPGSGYYSQADFVEILRYAHARHVEVIPELDLPGHARAEIKSMEARQKQLLRDGSREGADALILREPGDDSKYESVQMWRDNVVDVGRDATYRFLELVLSEVSDIYKRAGVPLTSVHLGGDEVPKGVWEKSEACDRLALTANSEMPRSGQLELYFLNRASEILQHHAICPACWEDCLLLEVTHNASAGNDRLAAGRPVPTAYVWNNVWGWGREDAAYRLANAGFDVVLCNATHLYFDLACEKDPLEPGYYWAGFVSTRAPFEFIPLDVFKNAGRDAMGMTVQENSLSDRVHLTPDGERHILGIQGQLWGENLRDAQSVEYMAFPRTIALAERAWARAPDWSQISDATIRNSAMQHDWNQFANRLGQRELPRLDYLFGGVHYRLPPPGAVVRDGRVRANVALPGLAIRYTADGTDPGDTAAVFDEPISTARNIKLKSFDTRGRGSRTVIVGAED